MKKLRMLIALLTVMAMFLCTATVALADGGVTEAVQQTVTGMAIEYGMRIAFTVIITMVGVLGTWLTSLVAKNKNLKNISGAIEELTEATKVTVGSLQQTVVDGLKAAHEDGKLTKYEIEMLGVQLKEKVLKKLSEPAQKVLEAASVDIEAWITDASENWINKLKVESGILLEEAKTE